jgi:acetate kinase
MAVLTINSGSSSIKFAVFEDSGGEESLLRGQVQRIGIEGGTLQATNALGREVAHESRPLADHQAALQLVFECVQAHAPPSLDAVGHRLVRGGLDDREPQRVTPELLKRIHSLIPYLPQHLPHQVAAVQAVERFRPGLTQVACFDTAFHRSMPRVAQLYALPREFFNDGILRLGYHGLSYEYVLGELAKEQGEQVARGRIIIAHLGNGCSMAAIRELRSVDTTMGFTPSGGLVMSTRPGDVDPAVVLYLLEHHHLTPAAAAEILNGKAGLAGVSGGSSDMRDLLARESSDPHAAEAIDLFCYQAKKFLGALAAVLGGLDTLIFTAGVGENSPQIRSRICEGMGYMGLYIDPRTNQTNAGRISVAGSPVSIRVIRTNEELMIARHTFHVIHGDRR